MRSRIISTFSFIVIAVVGCTFDKEEVAKPAPSLTPCELVSYTRNINPVIVSNCISCHNAGFAGYDLTTYEGVKQKVDNGTFRQRVLVTKDMPGYCTLPDSVVQNIECWLNNGAPNN